jgi:hypothetical protein
MKQQVIALKKTNDNWMPSYYLSNNKDVQYVKIELKDITPPGSKNFYKVSAKGADNYTYSIVFTEHSEASKMFLFLMLKDFIDIADLIELGFENVWGNLNGK